MRLDPGIMERVRYELQNCKQQAMFLIRNNQVSQQDQETLAGTAQTWSDIWASFCSCNFDDRESRRGFRSFEGMSSPPRSCQQSGLNNAIEMSRTYF